MSTDVSEVCCLQVLKKMLAVKHSYESVGPLHRFEFPRIFMIEFSEKMRGNQPRYTKLA